MMVIRMGAKLYYVRKNGAGLTFNYTFKVSLGGAVIRDRYKPTMSDRVTNTKALIIGRGNYGAIGIKRNGRHWAM